MNQTFRSSNFKTFKKKKSGKITSSIIKFIIFFFITYTIITSLFLQTHIVESDSMNPVLHEGDRILSSPLIFGAKIPFVNKKFSALRKPRRGEMLMLDADYYREASLLVKLFDPFVRFITLRKISIAPSSKKEWINDMNVKRVIGLPGDTIKMEEFNVYIKPRGESYFRHEYELSSNSYEIIKPNLPEGWEEPFSGNINEVILSDDEYFVLGDNRAYSNDSTYWGPVSLKRFSSIILLRYWPLKKISRVY